MDLSAQENGICRTQVFPGWWLDAKALQAGNMQPVLAVLQLGWEAAEHQEFVQELAEAIRRVR